MAQIFMVLKRNKILIMKLEGLRESLKKIDFLIQGKYLILGGEYF